MEVKPLKVTVRELYKGFVDDDEGGVFGFDGKLDIRPPYQREFIYPEKDSRAVINSILNNFPLNAMYWADKGDGSFEIIDGQQRTLSICRFISGQFSFKDKYWDNLNEEKDIINNYQLMIYVCSGTVNEKLEWFKTVNIAGKVLTDQELRNAVYNGPWVTDAKRYFSKKNCAAIGIGKDYLSGHADRQEYLEKAIKWISEDKIDNYMALNQNKSTAFDLWNYFQNVISWVNATFINKRIKLMKGRPWGDLYNKYKEQDLNPQKIEHKILDLIQDEEITNQKGIYEFILTKDEKYLNLRKFSEQTKQRVYEIQKGICVHCKVKFELSEMDADHIKKWKDGGKTEETNCQLLCVPCNRSNAL